MKSSNQPLADYFVRARQEYGRLSSLGRQRECECPQGFTLLENHRIEVIGIARRTINNEGRASIWRNHENQNTLKRLQASHCKFFGTQHAAKFSNKSLDIYAF